MTKGAIILCIVFAVGCKATKKQIMPAPDVIRQATATVEVLPAITAQNQTPVYFDFDRAEVRKDQLPAIRQMMESMATTGNYSLHGHADESGAPDYNLVLGGARAESVREVLQSYGVDTSRIELRSWGEELPAGSDAALNRRVELVIE